MLKVAAISFILLFSICFSDQETERYKVISLTKTECFGECPAYTFDIYSDLSVSFEGRAFTAMEGVWESHVTHDQLKDLKAAFEEARFFTLKDRYYADYSDLPTTYLYYSNGTKEKKVMDYYGAPEKLKRLEEQVEDLIAKLDWEKKSDK